MTPSDAHESAWQRDPSHDEMVIKCRDALESQWLTTTVTKYGTTEEYRRDLCECEFFCHGQSGPRFFVDLMLRFSRATDNRKNEYRYGVFEIKPKIHSAGALLRQIKVQEERMSAWIKSDQNRAWSDTFFVWPIVRHDDPLIDSYVKMSRRPILAWDGKELIREYYSSDDSF